jgi:hypothetical protein
VDFLTVGAEDVVMPRSANKVSALSQRRGAMPDLFLVHLLSGEASIIWLVKSMGSSDSFYSSIWAS